MRLSTIWSLPAMALTERILRTREWMALTIAKSLPLRIRYWVAVLAISKVSQKPEFGQMALTAITVENVLDNLDRPKEIH